MKKKSKHTLTLNFSDILPTSHSKLNIFAFILLIAGFYISIALLIPQILLPVSSEKILIQGSPNNSHPTIIIDAGHGGSDPGKVGTTGTLEKDINLNIALYLKDMLTAQDIEVILTRDDDKELSTDSTRKKASDMKKRIHLIEMSNADLVISIHQNSYTDSRIYGAQCFYYTSSKEGKELASILQDQIIHSTNQTKIRKIKNNTDYYLLKYSTLPTVIVECGFLSNPEEEKLLSGDEYQRKMAWAIHLGILKYLNTRH